MDSLGGSSERTGLEHTAHTRTKLYIIGRCAAHVVGVGPVHRNGCYASDKRMVGRCVDDCSSFIQNGVFLSVAFCSCHSTSCGKGWRPLGNSSRVKVDMGMVARITGATVVREERARYFLPSLPQAPGPIGSSSASSASESDGSSLRAASIF